MKTKIGIIASTILLGLLVMGPTVSPEWEYYSVGNLAGGLNMESPPNLLEHNQATNLENLLFRRGGLKSRYGFEQMETSKGDGPIWGVCKFIKSSGASQYLISWGGRIWVYHVNEGQIAPDCIWGADCSDLIKEFAETDSCVVTNASAIVTGSTTEKSYFRKYGYDDSINVYIGDSLRYIYQIVNDSIFELYVPWGGSTQSLATTLAFQVSDVEPTQFVQWLDNLYIVGIRRVAEYDGEDAIMQPSSELLKYNVSSVSYENYNPPYLQVLCTPDREKGRLFFADYYASYNDTNTDNVTLNIPLCVRDSQEGSGTTLFKLEGDSSLADHISVAGWDSLVLIPRFKYSDTVATIIVDSCSQDSIAGVSSPTWAYHIYDYSALPSCDSNKYNYGHYRLRDKYGKIIDSWGRYPARARVDDRDSAYFWTYFRHQYSSADTIGEDDTLYLIRYTESAPRVGVARYIATWRDRMFFAGFAEAPTYIEYSEAFDPDSFLSYNFVYLNKDDGDQITGLFTLGDDLQIPKRNHLYKLIGIPNIEMQAVTVSEEVGVSAPFSVVVREKMAYFFHYTGFYEYDGQVPRKISAAIRPVVVDSINLDYVDKIVGGYFDDNVWWAYPSGSSSKNNRVAVYHPESGTWYKADLKAGCFYVADNEQETKGVLFGDADSGVVWIYGDTYTDNDADISCVYESPWLDMGLPLRKHFKDLYLGFDKNDSTQIFIDYYLNHSETVFASDTVTYDSQNFEVERRAMPAGLYGYALKIKMNATPAGDSLLLSGYSIKWKVLGDQQYDKE